MSQLPLPPSMQRFLQRGAAVSLSLFFDKGMDGYASKQGERERSKERDALTIAPGAKEEFLSAFARRFNSAQPPDFEKFLVRRAAVAEALGARSVQRTTGSRLAIGLGLPHPTETGFLFDRLTGCPYLPGSSVKGLLRAAARLVREGELEGDRDFWSSALKRIFGPEIEPGTMPRKGETIFYDAYPAEWPRLEVDVLTPHYGDSYRDVAVPPADWQNPVPVPFLTIAAGASFRFFLGAGKDDFPKLETLLGTALDWLGIGAKKSAGYGVFETSGDSQPEI